MTSTNQPKPNPIPAVLVYAPPSDPEPSRASWFRSEDKVAAKTAAEAAKLFAIEIKSEAEKELTAGVHEGALKSSGRIVLGSVSAEAYKRIVEHARKISATAFPAEALKPGGTAKPGSEQTMNDPLKGVSSPTASKPAPVPETSPVAAAGLSPSSSSLEKLHLAPPNPWDTLRVGARVLAAYWGETREYEGFWLATVKRIENGQFTLEWFGAPEFPAFKSEPKNIAVPHPEFRPTSK
jgi:hypothetical protein